MSTLSHRHGWTLRKDDAVSCTCKPSNPRHRYGWDCLTQSQIDTWRDANEWRGSVDRARILAWLEKEFGRCSR